MTRSAECPTLRFSSSHYLVVLGLGPKSASVLSVESAWDSLSPSALLPVCLFSLPLSLSLSLKQILKKMNQAYLVYFLSQPWNQPFSQRGLLLVLQSGETKIWVLGMLVASTVLFL